MGVRRENKGDGFIRYDCCHDVACSARYGDTTFDHIPAPYVRRLSRIHVLPPRGITVKHNTVRAFLLAIIVSALFYIFACPPVMAQDANSGSSSESQVHATQGNVQGLSLVQNSTIPERTASSDTIKTNPGLAYQGPGMSYSNFNCANGTGAAGSTFWASFAVSRSKESWACNFRANANLHASIDNTPNAGVEAKAAANMADYIACTTANAKVLKACVELGLVVNADTPSTTTSDTWHACHVNATMLGACKREHLVSQDDQPIETSAGMVH
jgi:hypothetical protein